MPRFLDNGVLIDTRTLAEARAEAAERAAAAYEAAIVAGMPYGGKALQIDEASTQRIDAAALRAERNTLPNPFGWRMADNSLLPLNAAGMLTMAETAMDYVLGLRNRLWAAKEAAAQAATNAAADAVTF